MMNNCLIARASFSDVVFKKVDLTNTSFKHSKFTNVKFIECILSETVFEDVWGRE